MGCQEEGEGSPVSGGKASGGREGEEGRGGEIGEGEAGSREGGGEEETHVHLPEDHKQCTAGEEPHCHLLGCVPGEDKQRTLFSWILLWSEQ